ncbi:MAG: IclR family transcriptional regulator [Desulfuromonadaceae bacterium]|nr:IclR family transcriptional regulator [Desulfuromonadaceae bacterium]
MLQRKIDSDPDYSIKAVNKTLEILEALSETSDGVALSQLIALTGMTRNCTFRILKTLCAKGLVEQDEHNGLYRLGICSATLAQKLLKNVNVINFAHPVLEDLASKLDEAIYLTVPRNDEVLFLDMVDSSQHIKTSPLLGCLLPFFTNAAGKVIKSLDSRDLLRNVLKKIGRKKGNIEFERFDLELDQIRSSGVAIERGGLGEGVVSVAVAIRDYSGKVIGAITLIGPSFRIMTERIENEIIPTLKEGADLLSGRFGYCPA